MENLAIANQAQADSVGRLDNWPSGLASATLEDKKDFEKGAEAVRQGSGDVTIGPSTRADRMTTGDCDRTTRATQRVCRWRSRPRQSKGRHHSFGSRQADSVGRGFSWGAVPWPSSCPCSPCFGGGHGDVAALGRRGPAVGPCRTVDRTSPTPGISEGNARCRSFWRPTSKTSAPSAMGRPTTPRRFSEPCNRPEQEVFIPPGRYVITDILEIASPSSFTTSP